MPGVVDLLETLKSRSDYPFGLLTGNLREAARIKLQAVSIHHYFSFGAYGDDHEDRNRLLPKAAERFTAATGISANYGDFVVIGDTPLDVQCSKPYGALSIAVCTGSYSSSSLIEAGADYVLKDLTSAINIIENL